MQINAVSSNFTRPNDTTAYASGDLIANSTTAGSVTPLSFDLPFTRGTGQTIMLRARINKSGTTAANSTFRLHLYERSPTVANGDNGAWSSSQAAYYLGFIDIATLFAFTDGCANFGSAAAGAEMRIKMLPGSASTIYGLLEARAAYTPAANEVFTVILETLDAY